eukprot:12667903-Alexandrium_andersonii.AAC.1
MLSGLAPIGKATRCWGPRVGRQETERGKLHLRFSRAILLKVGLCSLAWRPGSRSLGKDGFEGEAQGFEER